MAKQEKKENEIEQVLNLDCRHEKNIVRLNDFLKTIKPIKKIIDKEPYITHSKKLVEIWVLEKVLHGLSIRYDYRCQGILSYYEDKTFVHYSVSILKIRATREWIGNVYGTTIWEVLAKMIVKIYGDIKAEQEQ